MSAFGKGAVVFFGWICMLLAAVSISFVVGYRVADREQADGTSFHDMRVHSPDALTALVDPGSPEVKGLARQLGTPEAAYLFVRDRILYDSSLPLAPPARTLAARQGSCLSKAVLLASLYRALGMEDEEVRVVTGQVVIEGEPMEHAWVEIEHGGRCLQQDPTTLLGAFRFDEFPNTDYTRRYIQRELFCFNDKGFAVISLSNKFRGGIDPHLQISDEFKAGPGFGGR
jgi:transglutaminase-like putative cysteine protease